VTFEGIIDIRDYPFMKKLDKLILGSFIGPFLLTFIVVDFILLTVNMLKYFDERVKFFNLP